MNGKLLNAKLIMTVLLGGIYLSALIWALVHGKLDIQSFIAGMGPTFGAAWSYWFSGSSGSGTP